MGFKMGETCDGCDAIAKGLKKYESKSTIGKIEPTVGDAKKDISNYMMKAVGESTTISKKIAKNLKETKGIEGVEMVTTKGVKGIKMRKGKKY